MTAELAKQVQTLKRNRRDLLPRKGWILLEKLAAWCKGTPPRCSTSVDAIRDTFGWHRRTIVKLLDQLERLNVLSRKRRYHEPTLFSVTLDRINESSSWNFHSDSQSSTGSSTGVEESANKAIGAGERGVSEPSATPTPPSVAVSPAPARARRSPHTQARPPFGRARSARADSLGGAAHTRSPAHDHDHEHETPGGHEVFDLANWQPSVVDIGKVRQEFPDISDETLSEELTTFRVRMRSRRMVIISADEASVLYRSFMRNHDPLKHAQRRVETRTVPPKSTKQPAKKPAKAKAKAKAKVLADMERMTGEELIEMNRAMMARPMKWWDLQALAEQVGFRANCNAFGKVEMSRPFADNGGGWEIFKVFQSIAEAETFLRDKPKLLHGEAPRALTCECGVCSDWRLAGEVDRSLTASGKRELISHATKCGLALTFADDRIEVSVIDGPPVFAGSPADVAAFLRRELAERQREADRLKRAAKRALPGSDAVH
jgi:hypothetical protein